MTDIGAVGSSSFDPWSSSLDDDDDRPRAAASPATRATSTRDLSELPDLPDAADGRLARAVQAASASRVLLAAGLAADDVTSVGSASTSPVERRLDAFRAAATPTYHLPDGTDVSVAAPFRMPARLERQLTPEEKKDPTSVRYAVQEGHVEGHKAELAAVASKVGVGAGGLVAVYYGHGTPQQVHALTQGLLDAGKLPVDDGQPASAGARVRQMMCDYGIGFDCAGYTQQAFLSARGVTRAQTGFANPTNEALSEPSPAHFTRVAPENASPGDVVVLGPPTGESVGHRAVISARHELTGPELARLACRPEDRAKLAAGRVTVFEVDSSWGSGADPQSGGVQRHTWLYDATSKTWGTVEAADHARVMLSALPYVNHPLRGIYHYTGSP